jgi:NitT/TauT family transport system substrate-binding protein
MFMGKLNNRGWVACATALLGAALVLGACGGGSSSSSGSTTSTSSGAKGSLSGTIRLGVLPNVTNAPVLAGLQEGLYAKALGPKVKIQTQSFKQGSDAVTAMLAGGLDLAYFGPNPAINGWAQSNGKALHILAGSTSGGASLVVAKSIKTPADLKGKTLATPKLGNTQDVALRAWLKDHGYTTTPEGGGDVKIQPQDNALTLDAFKQGQIDGAWVPEPWATRLVNEGGGHVLVDERTLWPGGRFVTVHLVASSDFLTKHPDLVKAFLVGHVNSVAFVNAHKAQAQADVAKQIKSFTGQDVDAKTIADSWDKMTFTNDPIASSLAQSAKDAQSIGLLDPVDLTGIYDLSLLNQVLKSDGQPAVSADLGATASASTTSGP